MIAGMRALVVVVVVVVAACSSSSARKSCRDVDAKTCTERRECILDHVGSAIGCRDAVGCELEVTLLDVHGTPEEARRELVSRCAANPACEVEDRGCFCPCGLSGFPSCNCACGGGLPTRCAPKHAGSAPSGGVEPTNEVGPR